jgi:hypothetical protein
MVITINPYFKFGFFSIVLCLAGVSLGQTPQQKEMLNGDESHNKATQNCDPLFPGSQNVLLSDFHNFFDS